MRKYIVGNPCSFNANKALYQNHIQKCQNSCNLLRLRGCSKVSGTELLAGDLLISVSCVREVSSIPQMLERMWRSGDQGEFFKLWRV